MKLSRLRDIARLRTRSIFRRAAAENELSKELRFHLDQEMEDRLSAGLAFDEARIQALRSLGGIAQIQEECRDTRRTNMLENIKQDIRYALRTLWKSRAFTTVMVLTLGLAIGATSAIFSVVDGVLLRSLPYRDPDRLVNIFTSRPEYPKFPVNPNDFRDLRARLHSFESMAAYVHNDLQLSGYGQPIRLTGFAITSGFFHVLGISPEIGREFDRGNELEGKGNVAIISDNIWRTRFAANRNVIGKKIYLDNVAYTIVGVMPPGTQHPGNSYKAVAYGNSVDLWMPFTNFGKPEYRGSHFLDVIARLRNRVSLGQATGEINAAMRQLGKEYPNDDQGWAVLVNPLKTEVSGRSQRLLLVLLGAVMLLLLLACVNAANLLLARASSRRRELALRAAVGANRPRLIQQMLTESGILALFGALLGTVVAFAGVKALVSLLPADFPRSGDIHLDAPVFLFTLLVAVGCGLAFGIVPAIVDTRQDLRESLHESGRSNTGARSSSRLRNMLVVCEVTLACALLIGTGLMLRSFVNLLKTDPGFRSEQTLTATISLPNVTYKDNKTVASFYNSLLVQVRNTPGVTAAGAATDLPWTGWDDNAGGWSIQGETQPPNDFFHARYHEATPGFFQALGMHVRRGRTFDDRDTADSPKVLVINEAMARYWKHGDALGGRITFEDHPKDKDWLTVVGIVADVKDAPGQAGAHASFWWPIEQEPFPIAMASAVAVRSNLDTEVVTARLRSIVHDLDPNLAVSDIRTMQQVTDAAYSTSRFALALLALFAILAITLAAIGTYGVIAYSVSQRLREFGVRLALGAQPTQVASQVLINALRLTAIGAVAGVLLGIALSRLLGNLLYEVRAADPPSIFYTCAIALIIAALASAVPALRATRADPMQALRAD